MRSLRIGLFFLAACLSSSFGDGARADVLAAATVAVQAVEPSGDERARVVDCSGVLIEPTIVLTAGHCLDGVDRPQHVAVFAFEGGAPKPVPVRIAAISRHPSHVAGWRAKTGDPSTRRSEIAADLALLRLVEPIAARPASLGDGAAAPAQAGVLSGVGPATAGGRGGRMKRIALSQVRLATGDGARVAFASAGGAVCAGDSGGPISAARGSATVWGVAAAVLRSARGCGTRLVITPVDAASDGFRRMRAALSAS